MSYITKTLVPGEKVVYQTRLHWIVMLGHIIGAIVLWGLGGYVLWYDYAHPQMEASTRHVAAYGGAALLLCGLIVLLAGTIRRNATEMAAPIRPMKVRAGVPTRNVSTRAALEQSGNHRGQ